MSDRAKRLALLAVIVSALGYFVDVYDIVIYAVVRHDSLAAIGVPPAEQVTVGLHILDFEMVGILLGGFAWGVLGDRRGRVSVLFASILLYSITSLLTARVASVGAYEALRLVAGFGLAGELGAGATLVSELLPAHTRGWGASVIAAVGVLGALAAALVTRAMDWRWAYAVGGILGLFLLALRVGTLESPLFQRTKAGGARRGDLRLFVKRPRLGAKLFAMAAIGLPTNAFASVVVPFAREFATALHLGEPGDSARAVVLGAIGFACGDLASGAVSQLLRSRRKALGVWLSMFALLVAALLAGGGRSPFVFYGLFAAVGFGRGYWAVLLAATTEQFGTNVRATASTAAPSLVRGMVLLLTIAFDALRGGAAGLRGAAAAVVLGSVMLAIACVAWMPETFDRELDFVER